MHLPRRSFMDEQNNLIRDTAGFGGIKWDSAG